MRPGRCCDAPARASELREVPTPPPPCAAKSSFSLDGGDARAAPPRSPAQLAACKHGERRRELLSLLEMFPRVLRATTSHHE